jgi:hypothetical protein
MMQQLRGWLPTNPVSINASPVKINPSLNLSLKKRNKKHYLKKLNKKKKIFNQLYHLLALVDPLQNIEKKDSPQQKPMTH